MYNHKNRGGRGSGAQLDRLEILNSASQGPPVDYFSITGIPAGNASFDHVLDDHDTNLRTLTTQELSEPGVFGQTYHPTFQSYSSLTCPPMPLLASSLDDISIQDPYNNNSEPAIISGIYNQPRRFGQPLSSPLPKAPDDVPNSAFQSIAEPSRFFTVGRVFKVHWTEPAGTTYKDNKMFLTTLSNGQEVFSKVRRFVVVREMQGCCLCLPLVTHNRQGATKTGVDSANYAAVYEASKTPCYRYGESLQKNPFPIIIENAGENVDPISRLNFGRLYTVEHNLKVLKVGRIPTTHLSLLQNYFAETITGVQVDPGDHIGSVVSLNDGSDIRPILSSPQADTSGFVDDINYSLHPPQLSNQLPRNTEVAASSSSHIFMPRDMLPDQSLPGQNSTGGRPRNSIQAEELDPRYRVEPSSRSNSFWRVGRVFKVLWTETAAPRRTTAAKSSHMSSTWSGGTAYTDIRRFVVLQDGYGCSICSPISSYTGQATLKPNLPEVDQHAIIYTQREVPREQQYKASNGITVTENLTKEPIRVVRELKDKDGELAPTSRLNYSKLYTVEHNVPVLNIGIVHQNSMESLLASSFVHRNDPPQGPIKRAPSESSLKHNKR